MGLGFRISIVIGIPDFLSWIPDFQVQGFQFYKNKFDGWIWIPQAKFPIFRNSDYLTWIDVYRLNVFCLLGVFSCKYHPLKGLEHKIWLKLTSSSTKYLLEESLMFSFVRWGFLKRLLMPRPDIFIHNILNFLRHLGTETYGTLPWQIM